MDNKQQAALLQKLLNSLQKYQAVSDRYQILKLVNDYWPIALNKAKTNLTLKNWHDRKAKS